MNETTCRDCIYWHRVGLTSKIRVCHYLEDTGSLRCCPADHCTRKRTTADPQVPAAGPWLLNAGQHICCAACGELIEGSALEVTDIAAAPWSYTFLHDSEDCCLAFYRQHPAECLEFFAPELDQQMITLLKTMEARL